MIGGLLKSTSSLAIIAAAGILVGGLALTPAQAADLGGDCCADLEERVADLEATTVRKGNRKVSLKISGFINRSFGWYSDEFGDSEFYAAGRGGSYGSRIKFSGSAKLTSNWTAGYVFRLRTIGDVGGPGNAGTNAAGNPGSNPGGIGGIGTDLDYVYLSGPVGTFVTGHVYAPTKQISDISLGGHGVIGAEGNAWNRSGIQGFELEQNGAHQAVAWISPTLAGFTLSAAWADLNLAADQDNTAGTDSDSAVDAIDIALRYANEFGPIRIAAGIGYTTTDSDNLNDAFAPGVDLDVGGSAVMGSVALLHTPTGLNVAFSAGTEIDGGVGSYDGAQGAVVGLATDNSDRTFWRVEGGINQNFFGPGNTSIYGEYANYDNDNIALLDDEVELWGLGIVQHFDSAATELYVAYRHWEQTLGAAGAAPTVGTDGDVDQVMAGMRIKF